jgi:hypothetical protein
MITFCRFILAAFMNYRFFQFDTRSERVGSIGAYIYIIIGVCFILFVLYNTFIFFIENRKRLNVTPISIRYDKKKEDWVLFEGGAELDELTKGGAKSKTKG